MEYTKPLREVEEELRNEGKRIYHDAMTGEECASLFAQLESKNPNIKELIDRLQYATGNDRFSCKSMKIHEDIDAMRHHTLLSCLFEIKVACRFMRIMIFET